MRVVVILLLALTACSAQSDENRVEEVLKKRERAEQTGDFNAWVGLWTREKSGEFEPMRPYAKAQPEVYYRAMKSFVRGDKAVLLVQGGPTNSFVTMMLQREGSEWKIQDEAFRDTAPNPASIYALLPPGPGAFARAGSHWARVAPALDPSQAARLGWQMKGVFDESYLYPD